MDEERREQPSEEQMPVPATPATPERMGEPSARGEEGRSLTESWREVGEQLRELANRLAMAFRAAWGSERGAEEEETVRNLRDDLRDAADRLDRVLRRVAAETEEHRTRAAQVTREASERSLSEARVAAVQALRTLNRQLDTLVQRLEQETGRSGAERPEGGPESTGTTQQPGAAPEEHPEQHG
ncbi:MAG: hypothetical protein IRY92_06850 [Dactylosporangium sp.]|nr:hypothetical protein [Dactylosporangium sp.]